MGEVKTVLVRFLKRCFINEGGGRTVDPGDQARIPASHFNPELHENLEPVAPQAAAPDTSAPSPGEDASAATAGAMADPTTASATSPSAPEPSASSATQSAPESSSTA